MGREGWPLFVTRLCSATIRTAQARLLGRHWTIEEKLVQVQGRETDHDWRSLPYRHCLRQSEWTVHDQACTSRLARRPHNRQNGTLCFTPAHQYFAPAVLIDSFPMQGNTVVTPGVKAQLDTHQARNLSNS